MKVRIYRHISDDWTDVVPYRDGAPDRAVYSAILATWEAPGRVGCSDAELPAGDYRLLRLFHWHADPAVTGGGYYLWDEIKHLFEPA